MSYIGFLPGLLSLVLSFPSGLPLVATYHSRRVTAVRVGFSRDSRSYFLSYVKYEELKLNWVLEVEIVPSFS